MEPNRNQEERKQPFPENLRHNGDAMYRRKEKMWVAKVVSRGHSMPKVPATLARKDAGGGEIDGSWSAVAMQAHRYHIQRYLGD